MQNHIARVKHKKTQCQTHTNTKYKVELQKDKQYHLIIDDGSAKMKKNVSNTYSIKRIKVAKGISDRFEILKKQRQTQIFKIGVYIFKQPACEFKLFDNLAE